MSPHASKTIGNSDGSPHIPDNILHKRKKKTKTFGLVTDHWLSQGSSLRSQPWPTKRPTAMAVVGAVHYDDVAMSGWGMEMGASPDPSQGGGRPW